MLIVWELQWFEVGLRLHGNLHANYQRDKIHKHCLETLSNDHWRLQPGHTEPTDFLLWVPEVFPRNMGFIGICISVHSDPRQDLRLEWVTKPFVSDIAKNYINNIQAHRGLRDHSEYYRKGSRTRKRKSVSSVWPEHYGLATLNWLRFIPCPISLTNSLVIHSKFGQFSVDTSEYFNVSQFYPKENRTRKESRSVQCDQSIRLQRSVRGSPMDRKYEQRQCNTIHWPVCELGWKYLDPIKQTSSLWVMNINTMTHNTKTWWTSE